MILSKLFLFIKNICAKVCEFFFFFQIKKANRNEGKFKIQLVLSLMKLSTKWMILFESKS